MTRDELSVDILSLEDLAYLLRRVADRTWEAPYADSTLKIMASKVHGLAADLSILAVQIDQREGFLKVHGQK